MTPIMIKRILLVLILITAVYGCEQIEDNSPALQGEFSNGFFQAIDARALRNEDGSFLIQGVTQDETLTLFIQNSAEGTYALGLEGRNYASFENASGNLYITNPEGNGAVVVTNYDTSGGTISGTFKFTAVLAEIDTLSVQQGIFFEVPYNKEIDNGEPPVDGTFIAHVDGLPYNPFTITAISTVNSIVVTGATTSRSIRLEVPIEIAMGTYPITMTGFFASYMDDTINEDAIEGSITIFENNPTTKKLQGTFAFRTASKLIELGQFNVTYF
jgi:hypothetical protein